MSSSYVNDLRLEEIGTGDQSGTWGTTTNTNLELIGEALGYGTQNCFATDADATTTVADGASDPARSMYFKVTSSATLTATRVLTIAPNTISRVMFIENATTGSQSITISQGSGANVTIATGKTAVVYLDGAGSGAAVVDAMALVDPGVTDTLAEVLVAGNTSGGTGLTMSSGDDLTLTGASYNVVWDSSDSALEFADNAKAVFGAGSDLEIYHDGTDSYISDQGSGTLKIQGDGQVRLESTAGERYFVGNNDGAARLYYDDSEKLATTATGIDVTGTVTADTLDIDSVKILSGQSTTPTNDASSFIYRASGHADYANGDLIIQARSNASRDIYMLTGTTTPVNRLQVNGNGDISFYEDTGTTAKFFWDAGAEKLEIGSIQGGAAGLLAVKSNTDHHAIAIEENSGSENWSLGVNAAGDLGFYNSGDTTASVVIDDSGNVGIGTDSPAYELDVSTSSGEAYIRVDSATDQDGGFRISENGTNKWLIYNDASADALTFYDNANVQERMRIDSSGNLLVGRTTAGSGTGFEANTAFGSYILSTSTSISGVFDRLSTDGVIVQFRKDGTTVGNIGAKDGDIYIAHSDVTDSGLRFRNARIQPCNDTGGLSDASVDLGQSIARFKDLYLSGGVYLGGTAAANKLDDYEEGTWTPVYSGSTTAGTGTYTRQSGVYVKVGDLVYASCTIGISAHTGSGSAVVTGLPFSALNNTGNYAGISVSFNNGHTTTSGYQIIGFVQVSSAEIKLYETGGTGQQNTLALDTAFTEFDFSIVYRAA